MLLFVGTNLAFFPQHLLGLDGMVRRIVDYAPNPGWTELNFTVHHRRVHHRHARSLPFLWNVFITLRRPQTAPDDPWDGYTLEWATTSPPPPYNFDALPPVRSERPLFDLKHGAVAAHAVALPAVAGTTHDETRADAPEENLGEPMRGPYRARQTRAMSSRASPRRRPTLCRTPRARVEQGQSTDAPKEDDSK